MLQRLTYFLICFLQPILIFTPEMLTISSGVYLFGKFQAFIIGYVGIVLGIIVMYFIGRLGRKKIFKKIIKDDALEKYNAYVEKSGPLILPLLFLFPILPDNVICAGAGISKVDFKKFLIIALITKLITTSTYAYSIQIFNFFVTDKKTILGIIIFIVIFFIIKHFIIKRRQNEKNWSRRTSK